MREHRAAVFARRDAGEEITLLDILAADERDDAEETDPLARLRDLAARLSTDETPCYVWHIPAEGRRPASFAVYADAYAQAGWSRV